MRGELVIVVWLLKMDPVSSTFPDPKNMENLYSHKYKSAARIKHVLSMLRSNADEYEDRRAKILRDCAAIHALQFARDCEHNAMVRPTSTPTAAAPTEAAEHAHCAESYGN